MQKKRVLITSKCTQNAPFWCNFSKNFPSPTLPLSALRASVKPLASVVTCAPPPGSGGSGSAPALTFNLHADADADAGGIAIAPLH